MCMCARLHLFLVSPVLLARAFFVASLVVALVLFVKEYAELVLEAIERLPKTVCFFYLLGAYTFVYVVCCTL